MAGLRQPGGGEQRLAGVGGGMGEFCFSPAVATGTPEMNKRLFASFSSEREDLSFPSTQ
jgi:hypothetical protein